MKTMWSAAAIAAAFVLGFVARGVSEPVVEAQSARVTRFPGTTRSTAPAGTS